MDKMTICKWITCLSAIVAVILLGISYDKISKKSTTSTSGGGSGSNKSTGGKSNKNKSRRMSPNSNPVPQNYGCPDYGTAPECLDDTGSDAVCCRMSECTEEAGNDGSCKNGSGRFPIIRSQINGHCACIRNVPGGDSQCGMLCDRICAPDESGEVSANCYSDCMSQCKNPKPM